MSVKSPAVAYMSYKLKSTGRKDFFIYVQNAPLKLKEIDFITDVYNGLSYQELAEKYNRSEAAVYKFKRNIFEKLHSYDMKNY